MLVRIEDGAFASRLLGDVSAPGIRVRVLGVLRLLRPLDAALEAAARRPVDELDAVVRTVLRTALFEIRGLGIPAPVAGDGAVRLTRHLGRKRASGLVNAVIRRAPRHWDRLMGSADPALRHSHPEWLWKRWMRHFGAEAAEQAMAAAQEAAPLWVWFPDPVMPTRLTARGLELERHPWMPGAWRSVGSDLVGTLRSGEAFAQDPASQLVAHLATVLTPENGRVVDLCAAPGGKVARAARSGVWSTAVAADISPARLRLVGKVVKGCDPPVLRIVQDARLPALGGGRWDTVILDAPCTGTGTLRRHPELRVRLQPDSVSERADLQRLMIDGALELVAPGGVLLYSTCSVEPEENEAHFAEIPDGFEVEDLRLLLPPGTPAIETAAGGVRLLPRSECDGFTMHAVRRVAGAADVVDPRLFAPSFAGERVGNPLS